MLTVLFATRNGETVLRQTLGALATAESPKSPWELVVVDNGSTDATPKILDEYRDRLSLRLVREATPGKNAALNAGLETCEGDLIVIVDDDVLIDARFLRGWCRYLAERREFELLGGRIVPHFETQPPAWLLKDRRHYALMFGERDLPEGPTEPGEIYGGNMAVRRSVFERGLRFDEAIGPNRDNPNYRMGSETEFLRRAGRSGARSWFAAEPMVRHIVRPRHWSEQAWIDRAYRCGRGRAHLMVKEGRGMTAPRVSLFDRVAVHSPIDAQRLPALSAVHLARGFADECAAAGIS